MWRKGPVPGEMGGSDPAEQHVYHSSYESSSWSMNQAQKHPWHGNFPRRVCNPKSNDPREDLEKIVEMISQEYLYNLHLAILEV